MTEVKVVGTVQLPAAALETVVRTYSQGGQWQRAADLFDQICSSGHTPCESTVEAMFDALYIGRQGDRADQLLQAMVSGASGRNLSPAYNATSRTLARQGNLVRAQQLLEEIVANEALVPEARTYTVIMSELHKAGDTENLELIMEWRDYL